MEYKKGDIVRFSEPQSEQEKNARMVVVEDRDTRVLVTDVRFLNDEFWTIKPTTVYKKTDLEIVEHGQ